LRGSVLIRYVRANEAGKRLPKAEGRLGGSDAAGRGAGPFGGIGQSGLGGRSGGDANIDEFTERRWLTVNTAPAHYPY